MRHREIEYTTACDFGAYHATLTTIRIWQYPLQVIRRRWSSSGGSGYFYHQVVMRGGVVTLSLPALVLVSLPECTRVE